MQVFIRSMVGRCFNGAERDRGTLYHAVPADADPAMTWAKAACGARPGSRGNGWSQGSAPGVTCPRCQKKLSVK